MVTTSRLPQLTSTSAGLALLEGDLRNTHTCTNKLPNKIQVDGTEKKFGAELQIRTSRNHFYLAQKYV